MSRTLEVVLAIVSAVMLVGSLVAIPWYLRRLPPDYFVRPPPRRSLLRRAATNALGVVLILAGIAMLVLPGQGIVAILIGLSILDLPIKHRILRKILARPRIQEGVQRLRSRVGKPPFAIPSPA